MDRKHRAAAFFDVDKTLLPGISAEKLLVRGLLRGEFSSRFRFVPFLIEAVRLLPHGLTVARKANKAYLAGADPSEVSRWGERLFQTEIEPRLGGRGRGWIEREREKGRAIVLLTGMPELLLEPFCRHFTPDFAVGTPLEVDSKGHLTGHRSGPHPYGKTKLEIARRLASERGWDLRDCSAYGDHASDIHLLRWVGQPFAVDPDRRLRSEAMRRGWTILANDLQG